MSGAVFVYADFSFCSDSTILHCIQLPSDLVMSCPINSLAACHQLAHTFFKDLFLLKVWSSKDRENKEWKNEYACNEAIKGRQESQLLTALLETWLCVCNVLEHSFEIVCVWFDGGRAGDLAFPWLLEVTWAHDTFFFLLLSSFSFTPFSLLIPYFSIICFTFSFPLALHHFPFLLMERWLYHKIFSMLSLVVCLGSCTWVFDYSSLLCPLPCFSVNIYWWFHTGASSLLC